MNCGEARSCGKLAPMSSESIAVFVERLLRRDDCRCEPGLTDEEMADAEARFGVRFPPLWREVLGEVLPVAEPGGPVRFPDWRRRELPGTCAMVAAPLEGVLADVERNGFWYHGWGDEPDGMEECLAIARSGLLHVPLLTPMWDTWYVGDHDLSPVFHLEGGRAFVVSPTLAALVEGDEVRRSRAVPFWSELITSHRQGDAA
jgi:hypothetical protein